ncbi:heterokaryon incompatibility protein-domain-containing protein [Xylaria longipes]|nr:heterokaryon incompatibility protein-domain-containing protein [Xylaria longipes]
MRLLNARTRQLEEFFGDRIPPYAIPSHTWGVAEVTFWDLQHHSAELSEAINSMLDWYEAAQVCYVFLDDVPPSNSGENVAEAFRNARWLTRGWTLQEFLAPSRIVMFNSSWEDIKRSDFPLVCLRDTTPACSRALASLLVQHYNGIKKEYWRVADVPTRLSWAARRQISRREDTAYCLLGLLGVKMPLLYGEGSEAFPRLLEEVIKKSNSHDLGYQFSSFYPPSIVEESGKGIIMSSLSVIETPVLLLLTTVDDLPNIVILFSDVNSEEQ